MPRARPPTIALDPLWAARGACTLPEARGAFLALSERPSGPLKAKARRVCLLDCPVLAECRDYAEREQVTAGMWAGRMYGISRWADE